MMMGFAAATRNARQFNRVRVCVYGARQRSKREIVLDYRYFKVVARRMTS